MECLEKYGFCSLASNDLLGIAYIRAINRLGVDLKPVTVAREGTAYNANTVAFGEYPSASAVRRMIERGELDALEEFVPKPMLDIICREVKKGTVTALNEADAAILAFFRLCEPQRLDGIANTDGGLANRLISAARESTTAEEMFNLLRTKRYTDAKLRRAMLFSLTAVNSHLLFTLPKYTTLLACNDCGREILASMRRQETIKIVTKPADAPSDTEQYRCSQRLDDFYALARKNKLSCGDFIRKRAYILK